MEHIKTFEGFCGNDDINEGFSDIISKAKAKFSAWKDEKLADITAKGVETIKNNPKLTALVSQLAEKMKASPKDAQILNGIVADPSKLMAAVKQQGGDINEALLTEGAGADILLSALKFLGVTSGILAIIATIVGGAVIGGAGFLLSGIGVFAAAIWLAFLEKPIEIPGSFNTPR